MHGSADEEGRRYLLEGGLTVEAVDGRQLSDARTTISWVILPSVSSQIADASTRVPSSYWQAKQIGDMVLALDDPLNLVGHPAAHDVLPKRTDFVLSPNRARPTGRIVDINRDRLRTVGVEAREQLRIVLLEPLKRRSAGEPRRRAPTCPGAGGPGCGPMSRRPPASSRSDPARPR